MSIRGLHFSSRPKASRRWALSLLLSLASCITSAQAQSGESFPPSPTRPFLPPLPSPLQARLLSLRPHQGCSVHPTLSLAKTLNQCAPAADVVRPQCVVIGAALSCKN